MIPSFQVTNNHKKCRFDHPRKVAHFGALRFKYSTSVELVRFLARLLPSCYTSLMLLSIGLFVLFLIALGLLAWWIFDRRR